jgi:hypothetical protein
MRIGTAAPPPPWPDPGSAPDHLPPCFRPPPNRPIQWKNERWKTSNTILHNVKFEAFLFPLTLAQLSDIPTSVPYGSVKVPICWKRKQKLNSFFQLCWNIRFWGPKTTFLFSDWVSLSRYGVCDSKLGWILFLGPACWIGVENPSAPPHSVTFSKHLAPSHAADQR